MRKTLIALLSAAALAVVPAAVLADGGPTTPQAPKPPADIAAMVCKLEATTTDKDTLAACVKQELPAVLSAIASCKSSGSLDAVKACVAKALGLPGPNGGQQNGRQGGPGQSGPGQSGPGQSGPGQGGPGHGGGTGPGRSSGQGQGNGRRQGQNQNQGGRQNGR